MKALKIVKENLFAALVVMAYIVLFIVRADMGTASLKNSAYYIKEMLMIMPVVFILTALLDLWVPKDKIIKYLGKDAKAKGVVFSLILGSISAGPVYAAFPLCVMLHKKGASIRNIVIILSAWAVIKVPMLLNEAKFLGLSFMAIRWALTVVAIIVFSWITAKVVKDGDLPAQSKEQAGPSINKPACIGCALCAQNYPALFEIKNRKAFLKEIEGAPDPDQLAGAIEACPVKAISYGDDGAEHEKETQVAL
jgi:uncharacterized membrane protein YraQ (UPF0718 family)